MSDDSRINELSHRLARPESIAAVQTTMFELDELLREQDPPPRVAWLIERAFTCLRELTTSEHEQGISLLIEDLLPRCLLPDADGNSKRLPEYNVIFREWLETLPDHLRHRVRQIALPAAIRELSGSGIRNALRLIGSIGYWNEQLLLHLGQLIRRHDDEVGDHALSIYCWLVPNLDRDRWRIDELHSRMIRRSNFLIIRAARQIGTIDTIAVIWFHWLTHHVLPRTDAWTDMQFDMILNLFVEIAGRSHDGDVAERVWNAILLLVRDCSPDVANKLIRSSQYAPNLNIAAVVPELIRRARDSKGLNPYFQYSSLRDCVQPAHMNAWETVPLTDFELVQTHATKPTGMTGQFSTPELNQKEFAWEVLLCRGDRSLLPPFSEALNGEISGAILHHFLDLAGCLAIPSIPSTVTDILAGGTEHPSWTVHERIVAQVGAIRAAHGAMTREAFNSLFGYRQIGEGVLLSLVDALAETAEGILKTGDRSPILQLLPVAERAPEEDRRAAAAATLATLLERGYLMRDEEMRTAALVGLPTTDAYACKEILFAFAARPPEQVPVDLLDYSTDLLDHPPGDDAAQRGSAALVLLSRQPGSRLSVDFLTTRLALIVDTEGLTAGPMTLHGVIPHVVGRYFVAEPERFGRTVAFILIEGGVGALSHLIPSIREVGHQNPIMVVDALVTRLRRAEDGRLAELPLIDTLTLVAPDRLLADGCRGVESWLPQARAHLATVLGRLARVTPEIVHLRSQLLFRLVGDGIYAVRRAAYQAAAESALDDFLPLALGWVRADDTGGSEGLRRRAAEIAGWLPPNFVTQHLDSLRSDSEPGVREAYRRSIADRDERVLARLYEQRVLAVCNKDEVIGTWRYGVALSKVGDDLTLDRLADRLSVDLPPSVRFWISRVRKAVERRWGDLTRQWPEPWFARRGHLETFTGTIRSEGSEVTASGMLWHIPAELLTQLSSWGGWANAEGRSFGHGELLISGRVPARILVDQASIPSGFHVFSGNGLYPTFSSHGG